LNSAGPLAFVGEKVTTFFLSDGLGQLCTSVLEKAFNRTPCKLREEKLAWGLFFTSLSALFLWDSICSHFSANSALSAVNGSDFTA